MVLVTEKTHPIDTVIYQSSIKRKTDKRSEDTIVEKPGRRVFLFQQ